MYIFFSSRRRHTRYWRDWSSDVCSSDLDELQPRDAVARAIFSRLRETGARAVHLDMTGVDPARFPNRSEERRVGKECRSRWSPYHYKKNIEPANIHPTCSVLSLYHTQHL